MIIKQGKIKFNMIINFNEYNENINEYVKSAILQKELRYRNLLYHSSNWEGFIGIMNTGILYGADTYDYGVSTSRNKHYAFGRVEIDGELNTEHNGGDIQLILDKDKLKTKYKIKSFDWEEWKRGITYTNDYSDFNQSEDKILTNKITDIHKYIIGLHIVKNTLIKEYFDEWMIENDFDCEYIFDENWNNITKKYKKSNRNNS